MKNVVLLLLASVALSWGAMASPAYPELITFNQPHSELQVNIFLKGDEYVHWAETEDGYSLLHADDGTFVFATKDGDGNMVPSAFVATNKGERTLQVEQFLMETPRHLRFSGKQIEQMKALWKDCSATQSGSKTMSDVIGEKRFLVVLFASNDVAFSHTAREFRNLFNQVNYSANGNNGSVHDYYSEVSQGLFSLQVDVVGPFTGKQEMAHYGNTTTGYQDFANEAVDSAAKYVNFAQYDNDHDGYIDGMHIIFAGYGEEATGNADQIWSHKWNIFAEPVHDSTIINIYSCSPECASDGGMGNNLTKIGVICHELGHVFGAPDYYDTDYAESGGQFNGLGQWDIMSGGSWNRGGACPAQHNAYTKIFIYHWATADTLDAPRQVVMQSSDKVNDQFHLVTTSTDGDFFILENRQRNNWDAYVPGHGMLVYHVSPAAYGANVDNRGHPQQLYLLCQTADTFPNDNVLSYGVTDNASTPYPGAGFRTSLTDYTTPALRPWSKACNNTPVTHISENNVSQEIFLCFKDVAPQLCRFDASGASNEAIISTWKGYGNYKVLLVANTSNAFTAPTGMLHKGDTLTNGDVVVYKGNDTSYLHEGLEDGVVYYYRLYLLLGDTTYSPHTLCDSASVNACAATPWRAVIASEAAVHTAEGTLPDCWSGNSWQLGRNGSSFQASFIFQYQGAGSDTRLLLPPFSIDTDQSRQHFVLKVSFNEFVNNSDSNECFRVWLKSAPDATWELAFHAYPEEGVNAFYVPLYGCSAYTQLAFDMGHPDTFVRFAFDTLQLVPGLLVHSYVEGVGGHLNIEGYNVFPPDTVIRFAIRRDPGYSFYMMYCDGVRVLPVFDTAYDVRTNQAHTLYATFIRNTDVAEEVLQGQLSCYPNPTGDLLAVTMGEELLVSSATLQLYDAMGRKVLEVKPQGAATTLSLRHLSKGLYLLKAGIVTRMIMLR